LKLRQFIPVLIIAAGIWAYHNSFQGPFILDDVRSILENPTIHHLQPIWSALSPLSTSLVGGRPIVNLSLVLNYAIGGTSVWGYHVFNLAVHVLAALTLYGIVRRTLLRPPLRQRFGAASQWIALATASIWTVHPLQTEAVTYISQRCESLMGLFYLLTLYAFVRGAESKESAWWFGLSVAACFLGMASKEVMVTAPVMVLLYDRAFVSGSFREALTRHQRLYLGLASSWLLLGYLMVGLHNRNVGYGLGITWWGYALTECRVVVQYLRLALWPRPLVFDYGDYEPTAHLTGVVPYALVLMILAAGVLFALKRRPAVGFVAAWYFIILAPTSSVVPIAGSPMAEHRMYLPLAAVVTLAVAGAFILGKQGSNKEASTVLGWVASVSVVALFTFLTIQRNRDYSSALTIWQDTLEKRPNNARAHNDLGVTLAQLGKVNEAIGQYKEALLIKADYVDAHNNLGLALREEDRLQEAVGQYQEALNINPNSAQAHNNLGLALVQLGRSQEAIGHYEQALQINSGLPEVHFNLGVALQKTGQLPAAIDQYEQALRINPNYADARNNLNNALVQAGCGQEVIGNHANALRTKPDSADGYYNLGLTLMGQGRLQEAISQYQQALRLKPDFADAHNNLGVALARTGHVQEAIKHWEQALRIKPDYADAHNNLGIAQFRLGKVQEAIRHYEQALSIKPDYAEAHYNLGNALIQAGRIQEAIEHYQQALRIKPDFLQAQNALARARAVQ
jgi:tetratricopeptide (TPR) repeat protein